MGLNLRNSRGVTLTELMVAGLLLAGVSVTATSVYLSGLKFYKSRLNSTRLLDVAIAQESISKKIRLASEFVLTTDSGAVITTPGQVAQRLGLRLDYKPDSFLANGGTATPIDPTDDIGTYFAPGDDVLVRYRLFPNPDGATYSLRWKQERWGGSLTGSSPVSQSDPEVVPGLVLLPDSAFSLFNEDSAKKPNTIQLLLNAQIPGESRPVTLRNKTSAGAMSKS